MCMYICVYKCVCVCPHSAGVCLSSLQLFGQTSVSFSQQDELLVQQEDLLLQLLAAAQLETHGRHIINICNNTTVTILQ